ncbi:MAG: PIN-like domain-containing protein [Terriglobales bacterium]
MASSRGRSKKQSAGSRRRQPSLPEDFVLYLDENLHNGKPILDALTQHGVKHERHGQHFDPGTEDTAGLPFVGRKGWLLVTKDKKIRYNELEKNGGSSTPGAGVLLFVRKLQWRGHGGDADRRFAWHG